jgi:hypothetical protein
MVLEGKAVLRVFSEQGQLFLLCVVGSERYWTLIWIDGSASLGRVWGRVRDERKYTLITSSMTWLPPSREEWSDQLGTVLAMRL